MYVYYLTNIMMMKRILSIGFLLILMFGAVGCDLYKTMDTTTDEPTNVIETKTEIVEPTGYTYDKTAGELRSADGKILYKLPTHPNNVMYPQGLEGNKLIVWTTGMDNSPGPGWEYQIWYMADFEYIDLNNIEAGLQKYTVPQWKQDEEKKKLEEWQNSF